MYLVPSGPNPNNSLSLYLITVFGPSTEVTGVNLSVIVKVSNDFNYIACIENFDVILVGR